MPDVTLLADDLRTSVFRLSRHLQRVTHEGLSPMQTSTLAALDRYGPGTPGVLAQVEGVRPPSMTRVLAGLEAAGLVVRSRNAHDNRQVVMAMSPNGTAALQAERGRRDAWLTSRMLALTGEEREVLRKAIALLTALAADQAACAVGCHVPRALHPSRGRP